MYGLVNRAIEDLIVSTAGSETWEIIKRKAGIEDIVFLDSSNYEDTLTYDLVSAASEVLGQPASDILHAFGRHWVLYTGREGWAALFDFTGQDFIGFVKQLDEMHVRVNAAMPDGRMPDFTLLESDKGYQLEYRTDREGLAPMVVGILDGLAEQFGESWSIRHTGTRDEYGYDTFSLLLIDKQNMLDNRDAA